MMNVTTMNTARGAINAAMDLIAKEVPSKELALALFVSMLVPLVVALAIGILCKKCGDRITSVICAVSFVPESILALVTGSLVVVVVVALWTAFVATMDKIAIEISW